MTGSKNPVIWTDEQRRTVLERAIQMLRADPYLSKRTALNEAMATLPPEQQRPAFSGVADAPWATFPPDIDATRRGYALRGVKVSAALRGKPRGQHKQASPPPAPNYQQERAELTPPAPPRQQRHEAQPVITESELASALPPLPELREHISRSPGGKVRWTDNEAAYVARFSALALHFKKTKHINHAVSIGQRVLGTDRQRKDSTVHSTMRDLIRHELSLIRRTESKMLRERIAQAEQDAAALQRAATIQPPVEAAFVPPQPMPPAEAPAVPVVTPEPVQVTAVTEPPREAAVPMSLEQVGAITEPPREAAVPMSLEKVGRALDGALGDMRELLTQYVAGILTDAVARAVSDLPRMLRSQLSPAASQLSPPASEQPAVEQPAANGHAHHEPHEKPRVIVVGMVGDIIEDKLRRGYGRYLDLQFARRDASKDEIRAKAQGCDYAVVATDRVDPARQESLKARVNLFIPVEGPSRVEAQLAKLADQARSAQHMTTH